LTSIVVVVSAAFLIYNYLNIWQKKTNELKIRADEYAEVLATTLSVPIWSFEKETIINIVSAISLNEQVVFISVLDANDTELIISRKKHTGESVMSSKDVFFKGEYLGSVQIALSTGIYDELNKRMLLTHALIILIITVFLTVANITVLHFFLKRPFKKFNALAKAYGLGNYDHPVIDEPISEFRSFAATMQEMGKKIMEQMTTIRNTEAKFRNIFENSTEGVFHISADWKEISINPSLAEILGYCSPQTETVMITHGEFDNTGTAGEFREIIEQLHQKKQIVNVEKRIQGRDNKPRWILISGKAVSMTDKSSEYYEGSVVDITTIKLAEEELRSLKQYLNSVVDSMPSVLVGIDANGSVTLWNKHAENATGKSFKDAFGKQVTELFPEFSNELAAFTLAITENRPQFFEKIKRLSNDETNYVDVLIYPLTLENRLGAVVRMDNVTQRVKMEQMMIQTEKILSVGGLAAGMAHEINNPLGVIMMSIQNIERRFTQDHKTNIDIASKHGLDLANVNHYLEDRKIWKLLEGMKSSITRASEIINNMLHYSRRSESKMAPNDLNKICDQAIQLASTDFDLKKKYDFRNLIIKKEYDINLGLVSCTETEIEQVILNLLKNAAQALNELTEKREHTIFIRTRLNGDMACIEIEDTGPGMDEATRNRIFEPFFTTKPPGSGTGLGLSVSYMIVVSNHQGTFNVESSLGKGCRFIIGLPVNRPSLLSEKNS
jgi:PAS domain S-box-containing protein